MSFSRAGRGHSKPSGGVAIDWTHPLAQGLVACLPMCERSGLPVDLCNPNRYFTLTGTPSWLGDMFGFTGNTLNIKETMNRSIANGPYSFSFVFSHVSFDSSALHLVIGSSGATDKAFHLRAASATSFQWNQWSDDGAYTVPNMTGRRCHAFGAMDDQKVQRFFFDGKYIGQRTASAFYSGDAQLSFPGVVLGSSNSGIITAEHVYIWNRALTTSDAAWLYQEPYAMFTSGWKRRYADMSALTVQIPWVDQFVELIVQ